MDLSSQNEKEQKGKGGKKPSEISQKSWGEHLEDGRVTILIKQDVAWRHFLKNKPLYMMPIL